MNFVETSLLGAFLIEIEPNVDERGMLARTFCQSEFHAHGLNSKIAQCSMTMTHRKGTIRGMHFQRKPFQEVKLVRCTRGAIYDVIIDLRASSPTFGQHYGVELSESNRKALYVPEGFAHGLQTLQDTTEVFYQMSESYHPAAATGVRWNDPAFGIRWPLPTVVISARDRDYTDFVFENDPRLQPC